MARPDWIGQTLNGRYQIEEMLGQGGMSAVYKATDPNLRRVVAVKLIHSHLSQNPEFVRRFESEASAVAQLRHPHIVQVFDFNHDDDSYYIIFEFVPGETLQGRMQRLNDVGRTMPIQDTLRIAIQVTRALDYAHRRGLVHRDIKPANVLLNVNNEAILTDFGIVKITGGTQHTATGAVLGTAQYMSPEQIQGQQVDGRSDLYSLGVTLFEMVGGRPPFTADSAMTVMMMHVTDPVPDVLQIRPDTPPQLALIIEKALAKNPAQRYQSAAEMLQDLELMQRGEAPLAATAAVPETDPLATIVEDDEEELARAATVVEPPPAAPAQRRPPAQTPPPRPAAAVPAAAGGSGPNYLYIGGGIIGLVAIIALGAMLFGNGLFGNGGEESATATATTEVAEVIGGAATDTPAAVIDPTDTLAATATSTTTATPTPTVPVATETPTVTPSPTSTIPPTATFPPTPLPTATVPPGLFARINNISVENGQYVVNYETYDFTETLPGTHVHFFFNTVTPENAGVPGSGPWILYGGPRPFTQYGVADKPGAATQMCILVANSDHSIILNSGNCVNLPSSGT